VVPTQSNPIAREIANALRTQEAIRGLSGVAIRGVQQPDQTFDIGFELRSGRNRIRVLGEIKAAFTPRTIAEIAPWVGRLKSLRPDVSIALIAPALSEQAQAFCLQSDINFLDLAGNVSINVPGKFTLRRTGMRARCLSRLPRQNKPETCSQDVIRASCASCLKTQNSGPSPRSIAS
jgi:hypothetical protein